MPGLHEEILIASDSLQAPPMGLFSSLICSSHIQAVINVLKQSLFFQFSNLLTIPSLREYIYIILFGKIEVLGVTGQHLILLTIFPSLKNYFSFLPFF